MPMRHSVEYAKSGRAKCHGSFPTCNGLPIAKGDLRHGAHVHNPFQKSRYGDAEMIQWRHWGCLPRKILDSMAEAGVEHIEGFRSLRPEDRNKVRAAISTRKIDEADYPSNAAVMPSLPSSSQTDTSSSPNKARKRKAESSDAPSSSQPSSSRATHPVPAMSQASEMQRDDNIEENDDDGDEVYVTLPSQVVGIQYYKGLVGSGEQVLLVREPQNKHDVNAVQVLNIRREQVGHIPRHIATRLAPLMDQGMVTVEGTMVQGNLSGSRAYTLSMNLEICGPSDPARRRQIEPYLIWATPGQRGFDGPGTSRRDTSSTRASQAKGTSPQKDTLTTSREKADELQQVLDGFKRVNDEGRRDTLLDTLCAEQDILKIPEHPNPPSRATGTLKTDLLMHQSQALKWCVDREHPEDHLPVKEGDPPVQFWQVKKTEHQTYWFNLATQTPQSDKPALGKGGIMADAMGLGKTLAMLALIIATKAEQSPGFTNSTLIVVPLSVVPNWEGQIAEHVTPGTLSVHVYHGGGRDVSAERLSKFDVVITTYQTVAPELDKASAVEQPAKKRAKKAQPLFAIKWKRVILDEGHMVRNPRALMTQAVCVLEADRRWVVTGTPIINSPNDLGSLLSFLRICCPLDQADFFKRLLVRPLTQGSSTAVNLLKVLMNSVCIRRTKEMQDEHGKPLVSLPPVEVIVVRVLLDHQARELYNAIEAESRRRFNESMEGTARDPISAPANVLSMLTRLRQLAIHPALVPPNYLEELRSSRGDNGNNRSMKMVDPAERERLQMALARAIEDSEECPICYDNLKEPRILPCRHFFCLECITTVISRGTSSTCPMDRGRISLGDLIEPKAVDISSNQDDVQGTPSVKTVQLIKLLQLLPAGEKSLVFSQFTSYLDKIASALEEEDIPFVRFDGSMPARKRQEVLEEFSKPAAVTDDSDTEYEDENDAPPQPLKGKGIFGSAGRPTPLVMLISLKAGALGLNLTVANNVFLMDPWWQESIESQAIDRVNRIGQKKKVTVYQLIADDTVESKVLEIQERKQKFIQQAFSGMKSREDPRTKKEARLNDLIELFGSRSRST